MRGHCAALAVLHLEGHGIGPEGARRLARVLGQCSSLAELNLGSNDIRNEVARSLESVLGQCSALAKLSLAGNSIGSDDVELDLQRNRIRVVPLVRLVAGATSGSADGCHTPFPKTLSFAPAAWPWRGCWRCPAGR